MKNKKIRNLIIVIVVATIATIAIPVLGMFVYYVPKIKANVEKEKAEREKVDQMKAECQRIENFQVFYNN